MTPGPRERERHTLDRMAYSAFISYSHEVDAQLAQALRDALQRFAKPWYRLRAIRVFQDRSSLAPDPSLWESVREALDGSEFLILLASPQSAESDWVNQEVEHWLETHSLETVLIVLTHGEIRWDPTAQGFDLDTTHSLPPALLRAYNREPLYVDLRSAGTPEGRSLRDPRFRDAVASLSAVLRGQPKDALIGEDVRTNRNARRLAWSGASLILALAIAATFAALLANQQRREAESQRDTATARLLGVQAEQLLDQNPELLSRSVLLAIEAVRNGAGPQAEQALRAGAALLPRRLSEIDAEPLVGRVTALAFDPDSGQLAIAGRRGLGLWDPKTGGELQRVESRGVDAMVFEGDEPYLRVVSGNVGLRMSLRDLGSSEPVRRFPSAGIQVSRGSPGWFAWPGPGGTVAVESLDPGAERIALRPPGPSGRVAALAFDEAGGQLAATTYEGGMSVWSLPSGALVRAFEPPPQRRQGRPRPALAVSRAGDRLAAQRGGEAVEVWRMSEPAPPRHIDHGGAIVRALFSPDGRSLATAGGGTLRIWDDRENERYRIPYETSVEALAFSEDGALLSLAERGAPVRIWNLAANRFGVASVPAGRVNAVALSPDSRHLATGEDEGVVRIWDLATGQEARRIVHPPAAFRNLVENMAFTPDGSAFALTTGLGDTTVWRLEDGQEIARLSTPDLGGRARLGAQGQRIAGLSDLHATEVWDVRSGERIVRIRHGGSSWRPLLSPDSSLVAVKRKSELSVYALPSGERVSHVEIDPELEIRDVAFSPGSGQVAIGGEDERVTLWDVKRDSLIARLRHSGEISDVVFAADARYLVTNQVDGTVRVFATDGWKEVARLAHDAPVVDIAVGTRRVATADQLRGVRVWDIPSGRQLMEIEHGEEVQLVSVKPGSEVVGVAGRHTLAAVAIDSGVAVLERRFLSVVTAFQHSKDGRYLAVGLSDGDAAAWDVIARTQVLDVRGTGTPGDVRHVAYSSDGDHLVTVAEEAHVWDLRDGRELARIQTGSVGGAGALSPDGALFAVGGSSRLTVFDVTTAQPVLKGNLDPGITSVAFSPDGALVAAAGPMGPLARVWRVATGEVARTITVDAANGLFGVAFHPDGQRIITAGRDGSVRFWSLSDGAEVGRVLQGTAVLGLDISADGRLMATTSRDYVVRVWSLDDNRLVGLIPHGMPTRSVALSGEGKQLATVNADRELSVWHLDSERLLADACDRLSRNLSWAEWQQYFGDAPYRKTCGHLPLHPSFVRAAFEIAQSGDPERARSQLLHAQELDPALDLGVDEAMLDIARSLDREGVELAEREEIGRAAQRFEAAVLAANEEPYDYRGRARSIAIAETIEVGIDQALDGKAADALAAFAHAAEIDPTVEFTARVWNDLCWFGAVHGHAAKVLGACDKAVELADEDLAGFSADSRGVARLAAGDPEGAISDFESFLRWAEDMDSMADLVTTRTEWITALKQGTDPLEGMDLRTHSNYMASYREKLGLRWQRISIDPGG